jgi:hypothetical protein
VLSISLLPSKIPGAPTAVVERTDGPPFHLHSRYDPLEEAQFLIRDVALTERTLYVVLGCGLGYHVHELLRRAPASSHVLVIEPDHATLSRRFAKDAATDVGQWIEHPRLHFLAHHDPLIAPIHLADRFAALRMLSVKMVPHVPSTRTAEDYYRTLLTAIPEALPSSIQRQLNLLDRLLENDLLNFWANLRYAWQGHSLASVRGQWLGRPLIIVSAGPSLDRAWADLADAQRHAVILATGTTARALSEKGIRPDAVVSVDPYPNNQVHFEGWDSTGTPLVYYHRILRSVLPDYRGPLWPLTMQDEAPLPLLDRETRLPFRRGGTVAFTALQLAHFLGASPIVFVGQDFAFARGRTHATGAVYSAPFDADNLPPDYTMVPGVSGEPVITSRVFQAFLLHMQEYLLNYARQQPHVRHINTSADGARIEGMEYMSLRDALAGTPSRDEASSAFIDTPATRIAVPPDARRKTVRRWCQELDRVLALSGDLVETFAAFRKTDLYRQAASSYDDVVYVYEARGSRAGGPLGQTLSARFRAHLVGVRDCLRESEHRK